MGEEKLSFSQLKKKKIQCVILLIGIKIKCGTIAIRDAFYYQN